MIKSLFFLTVLFFYGLEIQAQKTVLVITETVGYDHNTRGVVVPMIEQLGIENGFLVESTDNSTGYFTTEKLSDYAAILFMNTTGDFLNADEQVAFEQYINNGGGALFNHAAADAEYDWPFYHQLLGATFQGHYYGIFDNDLIVLDPTNIATSFLPGDTWNRSEEYYYYTPQNAGGNVGNAPMVDPGVNDNLSHLLVIDNATSPHSLDIVHPVSWYQYFEGGRSWYTVFGHGTETYQDENVIQHLRGGILFVMGDYNPNGPAMSVTPQSVGYGMKEGDYTSVPTFEITVTNATPSLGELQNLKLVGSVDWLDISETNSVGDKIVYTCALNAKANTLPLGEHLAQITISADSVMMQYTSVTITVSPGGPNLALNKPIVASSSENGGTGAANANDGNIQSRWSSTFNDNEYLTIDLEANYSVNFIKIAWEGAYADEYEILMGEDLESLSVVHVENNGLGGNQEIVLSGTGRYVQLLCKSRATPYGNSLYEIEVFGNPAVITSQAVESGDNFKVYPTLISGNEFAVASGCCMKGSYQVDVVSLTGAVLAHYVLKGHKWSGQLQLPAPMAPGLYYVRFSSDQTVHSKKIIKL